MKKLFRFIAIFTFIILLPSLTTAACIGVEVEANSEYPLSNPGEMVFRPDGKFLFVLDSYVVSVVDVNANQVLAQLPAGQINRGIAVSNDGTTLFVGSLMDGIVYHYNISGDDPTAFAEKGSFYEYSGQPASLYFSDDGASLYLADRTSGNILILDSSTGDLIEKITHDQNGKHPYRLIARGNYLYVLYGTSHQIALYDLSSKAWIKTVLGSGSSQFDVLLNDDGTKLFVSRDGGIDVLNASDLSIVKTIENTNILQMSKGLALSGDTLFVADNDKNRVAQINLQSDVMDLISDTCSTGREPKWMASTKNSGRVYVSGTDNIYWFQSQGPLQVLFQERDGQFRVVEEVLANVSEQLTFQVEGGSGDFNAFLTGGGTPTIENSMIYVTAPAQIGLNELMVTDANTQETIRITINVGEKFTIMTTPATGGGLTISPEKEIYDSGESVVITANPNDCYSFIGWTDSPCTSTEAECSVIMSDNYTITPIFQINTYTVNITGSNGTVILDPPGSSYECGTTVTLSAEPDLGYGFMGWSGENITGDERKITLTVNQEINITALFESDLKINPSHMNISPNSQRTATITGGSPPYELLGYGENISDVTHNDNKLVITTGNEVGESYVEISDSIGNKTKSNISVYDVMTVSQTRFSLPINTSKNLSIQGGIPEYILSIHEGTGKVEPTLTGGQLNITGLVFGNVDIIVRDQSQQAVSIQITVSSEDMLVSPQSIQSKIGETHNIDVTGGSGNYNWTATEGSIQQTDVNAFLYTAPDHEGSFTITFEDGSGKRSKLIDVTVVPEYFVLSPSQHVMYPNDSTIFRAIGGTGLYTFSQDVGEINQNNETIIFTAPGQTGQFNITAFDEGGNEANASINVISAIMLNPAISYVNPNEKIELNVSGGTGTYQFAIEAGEYPEENNGKVLYSCPDRLGTYHVSVSDSLSNSASSLIVVGNAPKILPSYVFASRSETIPFNVKGGFPPYEVVYDTGNVTVIGQGAYEYQAPDLLGTYLVTVTDSRTLNNQMTVEVGHSDVEITPKNIVLSSNDVGRFNIIGGKPPYKVIAEVGSLSETGQGEYRYQAPDQKTLTGGFYIKVEDSSGNKTSAVISVDNVTPVPTSAETRVLMTLEEIENAPVKYPYNNGNIGLEVNFPVYSESVDIYLLLLSPEGVLWFINSENQLTNDMKAYVVWQGDALVVSVDTIGTVEGAVYLAGWFLAPANGGNIVSSLAGAYELGAYALGF